MTKAKITKEINGRYAEMIAHKQLPKAYQTGMKLFKAEVVNFISSNFCVIGRFKNLNTELEKAIDGMKSRIFRVTACTEDVGYIMLEDGRKAKVTITVDADEDNW